jgi:hypothetical protein
MVSTSHVIWADEISIARDRTCPPKSIIIEPVSFILRLFIVAAHIVCGAVVLMDAKGSKQNEYVD